MAKKKMTMREYEGSPEDKKADAAAVKKANKKVPAKKKKG